MRSPLSPLHSSLIPLVHTCDRNIILNALHLSRQFFSANKVPHNAPRIPSSDGKSEDSPPYPFECDPIQTIHAVGHCHIDTAWLWPYAETRRKVARSWATQIEMARRYPHHKFCISQPQQMKWIEEDYPHLFHRVRAAVYRGHFELVGGTWVEMDANLPTGRLYWMYIYRFR